ncbi:phosphoribosyltransferase [Niabella beijingensis]|uniref:phosphoribosyltransferase n=1 Tax=Niabella beijingensis TaxID=2872700 RepID=UPI001CBC6A6C|nr:phosphoribosyltransferase [Niabella beijingensis]MBZ4190732.1 phosphoribosyltransferase [Niabella beijingensis]
MKLLLTSPDALINQATGKFFAGIEDCLDRFIENDENVVVVVSVHQDRLELIPNKFNPYNIRGQLRGSPKLIELLTEELELEPQDIIILGCKDEDVHQAANSKLLLLRALYAKPNNADSKIYSKRYGIGIKNAEKLELFFTLFADFLGSWYYELVVSPKMTIYALTDAGTINKKIDEVLAVNKFKRCLKEGDRKNRGAYVVYFLVSMYLIIKDLNLVSYWSIYPSSGLGENEDLDFFKTKASQLFKGTVKEPILVRTKESRKRHLKSRDTRIKEGCDVQFDTIILNPYYRYKLKGKVICVIDDFTTYGTSAETARILLEQAGVKKIVFICMGKFGREYYKYDYELTGDIFGKYSYKKKNRMALSGSFKREANAAFIESISHLIP